MVNTFTFYILIILEVITETPTPTKHISMTQNALIMCK